MSISSIDPDSVGLVVLDVGGVLTKSRPYLVDWAVHNVVTELHGSLLQSPVSELVLHEDFDLRGKVESALDQCRRLYDGSQDEKQPNVSEPIVELLRDMGASGNLPELTRCLLRLFGRVEVSPILESTTAFVEALVASGRRWAIAANSVFPATCWRKTIAEHFTTTPASCMLWSSDVGWRKPHPESINRSIAESGFDPCEAIYVGNKPRTDLLGARRAGVRALLVGGFSGPIRRDERGTRMTVTDLWHLFSLDHRLTAGHHPGGPGGSQRGHRGASRRQPAGRRSTSRSPCTP